MLVACMAVGPVLASHPLMLVCRQVQHAGCMTWPTRVRCSCGVTGASLSDAGVMVHLHLAAGSLELCGDMVPQFSGSCFCTDSLHSCRNGPGSRCPCPPGTCCCRLACASCRRAAMQQMLLWLWLPGST